MTLTLQEVAKTFPDGAKAVRPTSLTVSPGEVVSILGPSGCGKTTLLRIIAGLERSDPGGRVFFGADEVTHLPIERRHVGMVFQSYALFPNMNVRRNIGYGLKMRRLPRAEIDHRVDEVVAMCQLEGLQHRAVSALSGGQRQRVALARAVAPRPRMLLMDEPLSALDAALRDHLRDELARLLRRFEITAIFVTHDQAEALAIADRVAVMEAGMVRQIAAPETLYRQPVSAFVAAFVGHAQELSGEMSETRLDLMGGALALPPGRPDRRAFVRAEHVALSDTGPLQGVVESATFLGAHYRIGVRGVAPGLLYAHHAGAAPTVGAAVRLAIAPEALILLSCEDG